VDVEIELVGGLGNQLFGYFAGIYFSEKYFGDLTINFNNLNGLQHQGSDLRSFNLVPHLNKIDTRHNSRLWLLKRRIRDKILVEIPKLDRLIYPGTELVFDTNTFGEKPKGHKPRILLRGYFGNFEYYESVSTDKGRLSIREPSQNYTVLSDIAICSRPIMLHIRRGDYVSHSNIYGLLSKNYYRNALSLAFNSGYDNEIWVFSDDHEAAKKVLSGIDGTFKFIEQDYSLTPAESILLQSLGSVNIIANSTFSAWAATLNDYSQLKICPREYFRDGRVTPHWPPNNMTSIESIWE
jgi:hypothetical protein